MEQLFKKNKKGDLYHLAGINAKTFISDKKSDFYFHSVLKKNLHWSMKENNEYCAKTKQQHSTNFYFFLLFFFNGKVDVKKYYIRSFTDKCKKIQTNGQTNSFLSINNPTFIIIIIIMKRQQFCFLFLITKFTFSTFSKFLDFICKTGCVLDNKTNGNRRSRSPHVRCKCASIWTRSEIC